MIYLPVKVRERLANMRLMAALWLIDHGHTSLATPILEFAVNDLRQQATAASDRP